MINKNKLIIFLALIFIGVIPLILCGRLVQSINSGRLIVRIENLKSDEGTVRFGLFNSPESFPKKDQAYRKGGYPVEDGKCTLIFDKLPYGEYALAVGHDRNNNGDVDRFLGFPIEPVGVSGYPKSLWKPPAFQKAKFTIDREAIEIEVSVF